MAKTTAQAEAEHATAGMTAEANYTEVTALVSRSAAKALEISGAVAKYHLELVRARNKFEDELKTIEQNFNTQEST